MKNSNLYAMLNKYNAKYDRMKATYNINHNTKEHKKAYREWIEYGVNFFNAIGEEFGVSFPIAVQYQEKYFSMIRANA